MLLSVHLQASIAIAFIFVIVLVLIFLVLLPITVLIASKKLLKRRKLINPHINSTDRITAIFQALFYSLVGAVFLCFLLSLLADYLLRDAVT